jgi:hypothetical protein
MNKQKIKEARDHVIDAVAHLADAEAQVAGAGEVAAPVDTDLATYVGPVARIRGKLSSNINALLIRIRELGELL